MTMNMNLRCFTLKAIHFQIQKQKVTPRKKSEINKTTNKQKEEGRENKHILNLRFRPRGGFFSEFENELRLT